MKITIRKNVFETNSSSMHSVVMSRVDEHFTTEEITDDVIHHSVWSKSQHKKGRYIVNCERDESNWLNLIEHDRHPFKVLYDFCDKLGYYIADNSWTDETMKTFVAELCKRFPMIQNLQFSKTNKWERKYSPNKYYYGYVDHQSRGRLTTF